MSGAFFYEHIVELFLNVKAQKSKKNQTGISNVEPVKTPNTK